MVEKKSLAEDEDEEKKKSVRMGAREGKGREEEKI